MIFKEIKANFYANIENNEYNIFIERIKSGATPYGDGSAHTLKIYNLTTKNIDSRCFDTRYQYISLNKDKWIKFWRDYLKETYNFKNIEIITFGYKEVVYNE